MARYSSSIRSYFDIHQAFEAAGLKGTIVLTFPTYQEATIFCGRANAYRVLLRKQNEAAGRDHACDFDHLMLRRQPKSCEVTIQPRGFNFTARTFDGEALPLDPQTLKEPVKSPFEKTQEAESVDAFLDSIANEVKK